MYSPELCEFAQHLEKKAQKFDYREHPEPNNNRSEGRKKYGRDYARLLYSSSFRRLQGKMQLLGINPTNFHRNRLTHSLEVAQIARSIASELGLKDSTVAETCSLAHDLGNPPFGHAGETVLNQLAEEFGGYEGNAQTFRILRHLEKKHYRYSGLNLTLRTLLGVTKYFQKRGEKPYKRKFLYNDDYKFLKNHIGDIRNRSIDVQIMDLADEIAYAAHDLEDAISFGFVTIAEMMYEFDISDKYNSVAQEFKDLARDSQKVALEARRLNTSEEYSFLIKKELTSNIVDKLMRDIGITNQDGSEEIGYTNLRELSEGLKKLVFKAIQRKKDIQLYEKQGERVINGLFEVYTDQKFNKNLILLPPEFRAIANQERNQCDHESMQKRAVIDYIAGMMDSFAIQEYKKYFGSSALDHTYDRETWRK